MSRAVSGRVACVNRVCVTDLWAFPAGNSAGTPVDQAGVRTSIVPILGTLTLIMGAVGGCSTSVSGGSASAAPDATPAPSSVSEKTLTVTHVIDGDTVDLSDGRRVRLLGIDTPELGDCGYEEATEFARNWLLGKQVTVSTDPTQREVDVYGRALLYVATSEEDYSVAAARAGWARRFETDPPLQKDTEIRTAEAAARADKAGIWGPTCRAEPELLAQQIRASVQPSPASPRPSFRPVEIPPSPQPPQPSFRPPQQPERPLPPLSSAHCHKNYQPCVPDVPFDIDCEDVGRKVRVVGLDPYHLDGDKDGIGCEAYG